MIKIYGKVVGSDTGYILSLDSCFQSCYEDVNCILAQLDSEGYCSFYYHNTSKIINVENGLEADRHFVVFKCTLPNDTCPNTPDAIKLPVLNVTWAKTDSGWKLTKCRDDWKLFERENEVFVCMQFFQLPCGTSKVDAENLCKEKGSKLTGVVNREETGWMESLVKPMVKGDWDGAWIDGIRDCSGEEPNCHYYRWTDGYTVGNGAFGYNLHSPNETALKQQCLTVFAKKGPYLNAVSCNGYTEAIGVFCGYQLK